MGQMSIGEAFDRLKRAIASIVVWSTFTLRLERTAAAASAHEVKLVGPMTSLGEIRGLFRLDMTFLSIPELYSVRTMSPRATYVASLEDPAPIGCRKNLAGETVELALNSGVGSTS